jgi:lipoate-protein ligase B
LRPKARRLIFEALKAPDPNVNALRTLNIARLGVVDYAAALELQSAMVAARLRDAIGDTLLLLEHPHAFTFGRGADERYLLNRPAGVPVYRVSRGGQVTYHGPGQLVGYPILKFEGPDRDVIRYLRKLEQSIIDTLTRLGISAGRREGLTGVWVGNQKVASIGVGLRRWITLHGFALNVATDLSFFDAIVPCGIEGCRMTSVAALGHPEVSVASCADAMQCEFATVFGYDHSAAAETECLWSLVDSTNQACEALR